MRRILILFLVQMVLLIADLLDLLETGGAVSESQQIHRQPLLADVHLGERQAFAFRPRHKLLVEARVIVVPHFRLDALLAKGICQFLLKNGFVIPKSPRKSRNTVWT